MDPHIISEQPGLRDPNRPKEGEDGAAYLRRLRTQAGEDAGNGVANAGAAGTATPAAPAPKERRRSPRFQCSGSVEFQPEGSDVRMWGTLTDISLHGCYVEMPTTFPVDTSVNITIDSFGTKVRARATVRAGYPFLGMGMCFSDIEPGQQLQLEQLLRALAGERAIQTSKEQTWGSEAVSSADAWSCLEELMDFFKNNTVLSRDEFFSIAKRARRS
jgi:hypothetical protein